MPWKIYILLCDDSSYYIGITSNIEKRLVSHRSGYNIGTKEFSNTKLVYIENFNKRKDAERREQQIKGWTRAKKKALIKGDLKLLKKLSKNSEVD